MLPENITFQHDRKFMIKAFAKRAGITVIASDQLRRWFFAAGFVWGKYKERRRKFSRIWMSMISSVHGYPREFLASNPVRTIFDWECIIFSRTTIYTLRSSFSLVSRTMRNQLEPAEQKAFAIVRQIRVEEKLSTIRTAPRSNYVRLVRLIGKSFPNIGMEILLHNLADPSHSLICLENNVTGRHLRDGTTNLLIDLKKR